MEPVQSSQLRRQTGSSLKEPSDKAEQNGAVEPAQSKPLIGQMNETCSKEPSKPTKRNPLTKE